MKEFRIKYLILGWIQIFSYSLYGFDPFPINFLNPERIARQGIISFQGTSILRMTSLGGEPKYLAYSIVTVLSIMFIQILYEKGRKSISLKELVIILFLFLSLISTLSTQGLGLFLIDILTITTLSVFVLKDIRINKGIHIVFLLVVFLSLLIYFERDLLKLLNERTIVRLQNSEFIEPADNAVLGILRENTIYWLTGVGLGNIHLYSQHIRGEFLLFMSEHNVFAAKSGLLRLISELGIIGFLLFLYAYFKPVFALNKIRHINGRNGLGKYIVISVVVFINFMISSAAPPFVFFIMAISYSIYRISIRDRPNRFVHNNKYTKPIPG